MANSPIIKKNNTVIFDVAPDVQAQINATLAEKGYLTRQIVDTIPPTNVPDPTVIYVLRKYNEQASRYDYTEWMYIPDTEPGKGWVQIDDFIWDVL